MRFNDQQKKLALAIGVLVIMGVGQRLIFAPDQPSTEPTNVQPSYAVPQPVPARPPRNATEDLSNTLHALDSMGSAYNMKPEEIQDLRRIIESANYAP